MSDTGKRKENKGAKFQEGIIKDLKGRKRQRVVRRNGSGKKGKGKGGRRAKGREDRS